MKLLDIIKDAIRHVVREIARGLNGVTGGKLSPNAVTIIGLLAHIPIAWLITQNHWVLTAMWLVIFGLFDTLDGELARLQKRASHAGMFLDSVTDRMKEVILYSGIAAYVLNAYMYVTDNSICGKVIFCHEALAGTVLDEDRTILLLIVVLGGSLLTSYINAWGEAVMSRAGVKSQAINKAFRGGLGSFEIRIALIVLGLVTGWLLPALLVIAVLVGATVIQRLRKVFTELQHVQD